MRKKVLAALLALSMVIPNGMGANIASAATSSTEISVDSMSSTTTEAGEVISGKVSSSKTIKSVDYKATAEDGEVYAESDATVNGKQWAVDDLLLRPGKNTVTITVKTSDGKKTEKEVNVNYDNGSFEEVTKEETTSEGNAYAAEQLIVMFKSKVSKERCQEIIKNVGGEQIGVLYAIDEYQVKFDGADAAALKKYIKKFNAYDEVIQADYNYVNDVAALPNDPWGGENEWTENNPEGNNWGLEAIHAESAWQYQDKLSRTSEGKAAIKVGISDAGFDMNHEDLRLTSITSDVTEHYHGTHVAGTIGGIGNNGTGVTGVLWNADTIVKSQMGTSYVVELIQNGAKVVNCSWGLRFPSEASGRSGGIEAANAMAKLLDQGYDFLVVQSAGNSTLDSTWNGSFAGITKDTTLDAGYHVTIDDILNHKVIVGAARNLGSNTYKTAYFSNYGKYVDVVAPGYDIYSCLSDNSYGLLDGTSMAAPHVTGALAYIWSLNPNLSGVEVKNLMMKNTSIQVEDYSAEKSGRDSYPMVDLYLASKAAVGSQGDGTDIYFDNSAANWSQVYAYVWTDGQESNAKVLSTTLVDAANKIYKVTVPDNYKKVIFKNTQTGWVIQTGDLVVPTDNNNCWKPYSSANKSSGTWYAYTGSITTPSPTATTTVAPTTTVKFDNSIAKWNNVYAYVWNNTQDCKLFSSTDVTNNIYTFEIAGSYNYILFKNTGDTTSWILQTKDLQMPKDSKNCYKPYATYTKPDGEWYQASGATATPTATATVVPTATATVAPTATATVAPTATATVAPTATATVAPTQGTDVVFYYNNEKTNWSKVYAYVWSTNTDATTYEGTKVATNVYQFKVPKKYTKVLFKNTEGTSSWDKQTTDTMMQSADGYIFEPNSSANKTSGNWKKYIAPTVAPTTTPTITPVPTQTPTPQTYVTVDFDNSVSGWDEVYAYVWNNPQDYKVYTSSFVSGGSEKHYMFNIDKSYKYILFKNKENGWDQQTADLTLPAYDSSVDNKCFKPYSAANKSNGTWGYSGILRNRTPIVPSVSIDRDTVAVGDTVNFTMKSEFEHGNYRDSRELKFTYEDGTTEIIRSSESSSYTRMFTKVGERTYTYAWKPSKTGKIKVTYSVNQFEAHGEESQAIFLNVTK